MYVKRQTPAWREIWYDGKGGFCGVTNVADSKLRILLSVTLKKRRAAAEMASSIQEMARKSAVQHILARDMPESEKTTELPTREFVALLASSTMTRTNALSSTTYFALADSRMEARPREVLTEPIASYADKMPKWAELEKIPYFATCMKEGLL